MSKILKRDVSEAHDAWAMAATRYGEHDMATGRAYIKYADLRAAWEAQNGKPYVRGRGRA